MSENERYWLACYFDETYDPTTSGIGEDAFVPVDESIDKPFSFEGDWKLSFPLIDFPEGAAAIMKDLGGKKFVGSELVVAENGKTYHVPNYEVFESFCVARIDAPKIVEDAGSHASITKGPATGWYYLSLPQPKIPALYVVEQRRFSLSDPSIPSLDQLVSR